MAENTGPAPDAPEGSEGAPEGTESSEAGQAPDLSPLMERLDTFGQQLGQVQEQIGQQYDPGQDPNQPIPGFQPGDPAYGQQPQFDAYGNPVQGFDPNQPDPYGQGVDEYGQPQFDPQAIQHMIAQGVEQAVTPLQEQIAEQRRTAEAAALEDEFPELATPEKAEAILDRAEELAAQLGHPELGHEPQFIRQAYLAEKASGLAAQETPAGTTPGAVLEGGGGAPPAQNEEDDTADRIVQSVGGGDPARQFLIGG
jgi:hypothetical protein